MKHLYPDKVDPQKTNRKFLVSISHKYTCGGYHLIANVICSIIQ